MGCHPLMDDVLCMHVVPSLDLPAVEGLSLHQCTRYSLSAYLLSGSSASEALCQQGAWHQPYIHLSMHTPPPGIRHLSSQHAWHHWQYKQFVLPAEHHTVACAVTRLASSHVSADTLLCWTTTVIKSCIQYGFGTESCSIAMAVSDTECG